VKNCSIVRAVGLSSTVGLKIGDKIVSIAGRKVEDNEHLTEMFKSSSLPFKIRIHREKNKQSADGNVTHDSGRTPNSEPQKSEDTSDKPVLEETKVPEEKSIKTRNRAEAKGDADNDRKDNEKISTDKQNIDPKEVAEVQAKFEKMKQGCKALKHCRIDGRKNKTHEVKLWLKLVPRKDPLNENLPAVQICWQTKGSSEKKNIELETVTKFIIGHSKEFSVLSWTENQKRQTLALVTTGKKARVLAVIIESEEEFQTWKGGLKNLLIHARRSSNLPAVEVVNLANVLAEAAIIKNNNNNLHFARAYSSIPVHSGPC